MLPVWLTHACMYVFLFVHLVVGFLFPFRSVSDARQEMIDGIHAWFVVFWSRLTENSKK